MNSTPYRGRMAPSPTGLLHVGHAQTFWLAFQRAREARGKLVLRIDDLDRARCRTEFEDAVREDLTWLGIQWQEGPDVGGASGPYRQSERPARYRAALQSLHEKNLIYPCTLSRRDLAGLASAPHEEPGGEFDEPIYPIELRPPADAPVPALDDTTPRNWRFRVHDGEVSRFTDGAGGEQRAIAGKDFGDFLVWRKDGVPSYQLASVVDDVEMKITEVVRGADLITSTFRQLMLWQAMEKVPPQFFHCPLVRDASGARLAKRHDSLSLRALRETGTRAEAVIAGFQTPGI